MAHPQQLNFVKAVTSHLADNWDGKSVLEIGSFDVNGSIRPFFPRSIYTGVDLTAGPGVDVVAEGDKVDFGGKQFDVAISCECFEHNPNWLETFKNMYRLTRPGGAVIFTCTSNGRAEHGTTRTSPSQSPGTQSLSWDYYCNLTARDFRRNVDFSGTFKEHFFQYNEISADLYFCGIKKGQGGVFLREDLVSLQENCRSLVRQLRARDIEQDRGCGLLIFLLRIMKKRLWRQLGEMLNAYHYNDVDRRYQQLAGVIKRPLRKLKAMH